jgi:hypothetical protein
VPSPGKSEFYKDLDTQVKDLEAVKEIHNMDERRSLTDHEHKFTLRAGNNIQCICGWGLFLDAQDELKNGHLFRSGKKII